MTDDVVVVGGGLEGYLAALTAARRNPDASVRLVDPSPERFRYENGLVDVLGYVDGEGPVSSPLAAVEDLPASHPYSRVGVETIRDALDVFGDVTGDQYLGESTEENALVPTPLGSVLPAARYPVGMASGLASDDRKMLLVGFEQVSAFDAYLASDRLDERVPFGVSGVSVSFPEDVTGSPVTTACARLLDENDDTDDGVPIREELVETVRTHLDIEPRVGFPAVLGQREETTIHESLSDQLQAEIFEVPLGDPSLPGLRLRRLLVSALESSGVQRVADTPVVDVVTTDDSVDGVVVDHGDERETYEAREFVLATGGFGSGGLTSDRDVVREPHFGCHVDHPDRSAWTVADPLGDQPFARFGLSVDDRLRPLSSREEPVYANLRAAGEILGGVNAPAENSQGGIATVTGYAAGLRAVESLS